MIEFFPYSPTNTPPEPVKSYSTTATGDARPATGNASESKPYIKRFMVSPFYCKADYQVLLHSIPENDTNNTTQPKKVQVQGMMSGDIGSFIGVVPLRDAVLFIDRIEIAGIVGWARLAELLKETLVKRASVGQVASVLAGLPGIQTVVNVSTAWANAVIAPFRSSNAAHAALKGLRNAGKVWHHIIICALLRLYNLNRSPL